MIDAECVTPLRMIDTLPVGTNGPAVIVPDKLVEPVPKTIVGAARLLNVGVTMTVTVETALVPWLPAESLTRARNP